jgi:hypothetical protein
MTKEQSRSKSLSVAQLIELLQQDDCDDKLTEMLEEELSRRKTGGTVQ